MFSTAMTEKKPENGEVRYSAAYPTGAERCLLLDRDVAVAGGFQAGLQEI